MNFKINIIDCHSNDFLENNRSGEEKVMYFGILSITVFKGSKQGKGFIVQVAHTFPKLSRVHCFQDVHYDTFKHNTALSF